ncbi:DoxX family protein [Paracraurococcus lichenis]|uniref:DoxX family protein n=1 Tax=Paracraurococcus lichenis TaxID=3064888 RepID=A0ABT9E7C5_9PROT|nr:DoxX family protein [Paracraurococcus sp. LOR1-02]MDO9712051.1 DoxX family protein [Paracraurococcus sp. LOR1-02]
MPSDIAARPAAAPASQDLGLLVARVMLSALFLYSGWAKFSAPDRTAGYFGSLGLPMPGVMVWVAIAAELVLPILLLIGIRARWVAFALCVFTLVTALTGHKFWTFDAATQAQQASAQLTQFLKNLGIAGGFLVLGLTGPGRYAADRRG